MEITGLEASRKSKTLDEKKMQLFIAFFLNHKSLKNEKRKVMDCFRVCEVRSDDCLAVSFPKMS